VLVDDLLRILERRPGLTTAQIVSALGEEGSRSPRAVELALAQGRERFSCDSQRPARWCLRGEEVTGGAPGPRPGEGSAVAIAGPQLYSWQRDALEAWGLAGHRGVVEAVTGAGKTMLGLAATVEEIARRGQVLVVVPTVELLHQWLRQLAPVVPRGFTVGAVGAGRAASFSDSDVVVGVVNTLRAADIRPTRRGGLLVADECHRYGSTINRLALDVRFERRLGLSATYARDDDGHLAWLDPYFGGTCFQLGYRRAVRDGVVARFTVALIGVRLGADERRRYDELTEEVRRRFARLAPFDLPLAPFGAFLAAVSLLASGRRGGFEGTLAARCYLAALFERRRLLADATVKTDVLGELAPALAAADRAIVFTRSIETAALASGVLAARGLRSGVIHSGLPAADRRAVLGAFAAGRMDAISAPRVLDEGIDVPAADVAVIVGASHTRRQMVQRMGRVLRVKADGRLARFAVLFVQDTIEDPAHGAHESFLGEVTDVADEVRRFESSEREALDEAIAFLAAEPARHQPCQT
jgi:superfamily II DNA or RNA helicase